MIIVYFCVKPQTIYSNKLQFRKNIFKKLHVSGPKSQYTSIRVQPDNLSLLAFEIKNHIETNAQNACLSIASSLELLIMCLLFLNHLLQDILLCTSVCLSTSIRYWCTVNRTFHRANPSTLKHFIRHCFSFPIVSYGV